MINAKTKIKTRNGRRQARLRPRWMYSVAAAGLAAAVVGCDLDVATPDIVTPADLQNEAGLDVLTNGAISDINLAFAGSAAGHGATPGLVHYSGTISDEYIYSGTFPTRQEVDFRAILNSNVSTLEVYENLHRARVAAATASAAIQEFSSPSTDPRFGLTKSLEAFTYLLFGEAWCSGVPFSFPDPEEGLIFGQPLTTQEMFQFASGLLDEAISSPGGSSDVENLARVLKGRTLLNLGNAAGAAAAVASVPTSFVYELESNDATQAQQSGVLAMSNSRRQYSIAEVKGINGLPYRSANDPRTPWNPTGQNGQDDITLYFNQLKFPSSSSNIPIADGLEARLIEAEAMLLASGPGGQFDAIHDALRASVGLGPVDTSGMTQAEATDWHFGERAFWLWSTGHRQGDMRRLVREYGRGAETVFPTGLYFKGGTFGPDMNYPIPVEEENNQNFVGCLDRNA